MGSTGVHSRDCSGVLENKDQLRPIRLSDCLLAIITKDPANRTRVIVESSGQFIFCVFGDVGKKAGPSWNLLDDDLSHQSSEFIAFLAGLLAENK